MCSLEVTIFMNHDADYKGRGILQLPEITNAIVKLCTKRCYPTYLLEVMINKKKSDELGPVVYRAIFYRRAGKFLIRWLLT